MGIPLTSKGTGAGPKAVLLQGPSVACCLPSLCALRQPWTGNRDQLKAPDESGLFGSFLLEPLGQLDPAGSPGWLCTTHRKYWKRLVPRGSRGFGSFHILQEGDLKKESSGFISETPEFICWRDCLLPIFYKEIYMEDLFQGRKRKKNQVAVQCYFIETPHCISRKPS